MAGSNKVVLKFLADVDGINRGVEEVNSKLSHVGKAALGVGAAIATGFVADKVLDFAAASVKAAQESDIANQRLEQIAKTMGYADGQYKGATDRVEEYAGALSRQIGVEDESIKAVQAKLLTFSAVGDTVDKAGSSFDRATQAAYDLASAGFGQAESNAVQLGKALQDPEKGITALAKSGVSFTEAEKEKIKALVKSGDLLAAQNMVLSAVEKQVGGTAAATVTGAQKMQIAWGELQETIGAGLGPAITEIATALAPVIDSLAGPLGEVAKTVGGALSQAFAALQPVLPVLADALGKIAGVLGDVLVTAIDVLVPIITPLIEAFGEIATRIGPILQPVLEKIGQVLGKVFDAVMPLLGPLTDLVFGILEAAMPIVDVAAEVLMVLVDALKPLLNAVMVLLQPLGDLVKVALAAIMPVIKPLLPIFELLASILSDVLVRAIGIITGAVGLLIIGFSKLAPFILTNVTKPIVEAFLTMAENVLGAAESMLGWVPGLGDKLTEAKNAFGKFKEGAVTGIQSAADTIATEGSKIGQTLLDSAGKAITDPASLSSLESDTKTSASTVGTAFGTGMAQGMKGSTGEVTAAATRLTRAAEIAARSESQTQSPSKKWAALGVDLATGLEEGFWSKKDRLESKVKELMKSMAESSREVIAVSWKQLGTDISSELDGVSLQVSKKAEEVFVINEAAWSKRLAQFKAVITEQQNIITQAEQAIESVAQSFKDNVLGQIKFGLTDKDGNALTPEQIVSAIFGDITKQKEVVNQIATNIGTALPPELLNQILAMPPDTAIALAKYLGEHPEMLAQLTTDYEALGTFTYTTLGVPMGKAWAKIGNESASTMIVQAKKVIDEEAADFKAWVKSKLATTVVVKVRYEAENNPNDVLKSIGSYEAANGTSWRT